jgi:hypothetical protein
MRFRFHSRFAHITTLALALGALVLAVGMPTLTSSFVPSSSHSASACAQEVEARLFFGLHGPMGTVSDSDWEMFLAEVVTPRFPDGLTVFRASGQWRGSAGRLEQEPSRVVEIIHHDSPDARGRIDEIVTIYKTRYQQESVLVARKRAEVCF